MNRLLFCLIIFLAACNTESEASYEIKNRLNSGDAYQSQTRTSIVASGNLFNMEIISDIETKSQVEKVAADGAIHIESSVESIVFSMVMGDGEQHTKVIYNSREPSTEMGPLDEIYNLLLKSKIQTVEYPTGEDAQVEVEAPKGYDGLLVSQLKEAFAGLCSYSSGIKYPTSPIKVGGCWKDSEGDIYTLTAVSQDVATVELQRDFKKAIEKKLNHVAELIDFDDKVITLLKIDVKTGLVLEVSAKMSFAALISFGDEKSRVDYITEVNMKAGM